MKKLFGWLFSPWLLVLLGLIALSLLIWFVGPLVAIAGVSPLEPERPRLLLIAAVWLAYALKQALSAWSSWRANRRVTAQLVQAAPSDGPEDAEAKILRERFERAVATLRQARFAGDGGVGRALSARLGKRYLYELPWYLIIGAPGSGKTTALMNAGLRFALDEPAAAGGTGRRIAGVGGTRNCDWWFTEQAVLIDTAGRYTTQDSHEASDKAAWQSFLGLLKKGRPRQPINGALVTVAVSDLLRGTPEERALHAAAVRARVQELHEHFGVRFPIYLLVTKCDLLAGFVDYLGPLDAPARREPWGYTFDLKDTWSPERVDGEHAALTQRLVDGLIERLQAEPDPERRARLYAFPAQFDGLRPVLGEFVASVFAPSRFEAAAMLRGVYIVSGTQEGTPLDRLIGRVAREMHLPAAAPPPLRASGKSYFIEGLLHDLIFAESALGGTNLRWERRRATLAAAGYAGVATVTLGLGAAWAWSAWGQQAYLREVAARTEALEGALRALPPRPADDLMAPLPLLAAAGTVADPPAGLPPGWGLAQQDKLQAAAGIAQRRLRGEIWLPRVAARLEGELRASAGQPALQYEMLKAYLMLHRPERLDADALRAYLAADWQARLPADLPAETRTHLNGHLDALLAERPLPQPRAEDATLVARVRQNLTLQPLPQRVYQRLKIQGLGREFAEFTVAQAGGAAAALVFQRASGQPLTRGVPGLYTFEAYHEGVQAELPKLAAQMAEEESWVLGVTDGSRVAASGTGAPAAGVARVVDAALGRDQARVANEVRRLYLNDYAAAWQAFIGDLHLVPVTGLDKSIEIAQILSSPAGPLPLVMRALSRQTTLMPPKTGAQAQIASAADTAQAVVQRTTRELGKLFAPTGAGPAAPVAPEAPSIEKQLVDDRFRALRDLVQPAGGQAQGPAPLDSTVALINELYTQLSATQAAVQGGTAPPPSGTATKVRAEAARLPEPLRDMVTQLSQAGHGAALKATRSNLGQSVSSDVGEFCRKAIAGRYPFVRGSDRDVTPDDFARLFAPGGLMDEFFQKNLAPYVNTATRPWSFRSVDGVSMGGGSGTLIQFQRAAEIRDTFFRSGARTPGFRLDLKPLEMDAAVSQFTLDVDGQAVQYAHGPQLSTTVTWPGPRGSQQVRMGWDPPSASGRSGSSAEGPWALMRLIDRQTVQPSAVPERMTVSFSLDGRRAVFEVTSGSVQNPLRLRALQEFACPGGL